MQDYKKQTDESLAILAKTDNGAMEELMRRYKDVVLRCARKFSFRLLAETDDLVQEGMMSLVSAVGSYQPAAGRSFKGFAYICITRRIVSYLRSASRHFPSGEPVALDPETIAENVTPEDLILGDESAEEFRLRLLNVLSDFEFRVVSMYLEGMSYQQISLATGREVKSIDNALARSKRKLMSYLR